MNRSRRLLCVLPEHGGQVREDEDAFITTAPELVWK